MELTIPLTPPSGNHYKVPVWNQRCFYVTPEAKAFKDAIAIFARGDFVGGHYFSLDVTIYLGKGERGDADNLVKVLKDGLQEANVFGGCADGKNGRSDACVKDLRVRLDRDWKNPRTVVRIEAI